MSHWRGGVFPQPGFSLKLLLSQTPGEVKVGSETPKGTPSFSVRGNSQSGSPERDAKCDTKSRRKGCPGHRSWTCLGPRIARSSSRSASWKGCVVAPDARDIRTLSIQGLVRVMIRAPKVAKGEILRKGGLSLSGEGFPPPSLRGRERKPNWTIATRSMRLGTRKAGRHSGRSRTWSPCPSFSSCSASPAIGGMGDGKSGFIVPRGLTVPASWWMCPCWRGFGALLPPGSGPWCDEEGPPP